MEDLWKPHSRAHQSFVGSQVNANAAAPAGAAASQLHLQNNHHHHHPFVAQEVCVTIRQETLGAANLINFGGLEGGLKHQIRAGDQASNQLLALVQQQAAAGIVAPLNTHLQPSSANVGVAWSGVPEIYPSATRPLVTDACTPLERDSPLVKNRNRTPPESLETALLKKSNVDFFKDSSLPRSSYDSTTLQCPAEFRSQQTQPQLSGQTLPLHKKTIGTSSAPHGFPAGLRVFTPGIQGFLTNGELLLTEKGRLEVVCSCHSWSMTVAKFVQHAGSHSVNPGSAVYLETGETLVQWRRNVFTRVGVPVPDDEEGWDSCDGNGCETGRTRHAKVPDAFTNCQPAQVTSLAGNLSYGNHPEPVFQGFNRNCKLNASAELIRDQSSNQLQRVVGAVKPVHFDFINGRTYSSSPAEQHPTRRMWDERLETVRQEKDSFASSFELRLGQPSQQAHKAGTSFGTLFRSQFPTTEPDQPSSLIYERAYQKTVDATLHQSGYAFQAQQDVHQFTQQQRLQKINVLNINQLGAAGLERTVLSERTKVWTEPPNQETLRMSQNGNKAPPEHVDTVCLLKPQLPDNSLELLPQSHMKQRLVNNRLLNDVVGFSQIDGQQYFTQDYSQSGWSTSGTRYIQSKEREEVVQCFGSDGTRAASQDILACRMTSNSFVQQQQALEHKGTESELDGHVTLQIVREQLGTKARLSEHRAAEPEIRNVPSACPGNTVLGQKSTAGHPYIVDELNRNSSANPKPSNDEANSSQNLTRDGFSEHHNEDTSSIIPPNPGILVSVAENEMPLDGSHSKKNLSVIDGPVSQSFGWNASAKSFCGALGPLGDVRDEGILATSAEQEDENSQVSAKSSENAFSGAPDDVNEDSSTLESESHEPDLVCQGPDIEKCSSDKCGEAGNRECSHSTSDHTSSEANDSIMIEGLHESAEAEPEDEVQLERRKVVSLNDTVLARNDDPSRSPDSGVPASHHEQKHAEQKACRKIATKQKRSGTEVRKTRSAARKDIKGAKVNERDTVLEIKLKSRDSPVRARSSDSGCDTKSNRRSTTGNGKMMSLKSIMEHSTKRTTTNSGVPGAKIASKIAEGQKDDAVLRRETRKRKLSELNSPMPDTSANVACRPFRVGVSIIPRGERSPRGAPRKAKELVTSGTGNESQKNPKKRQDVEQNPMAENKITKRRRTTIRSQTPTAVSPVNESRAKWKSLEDDVEMMKQKIKLSKQSVCSVCTSAKSESHNQLISCSSCPVKVHQACYGVPKVPKSSWVCRACKSEVDNIACVLCGYRGGAMTRAQNARTVVKGLLKAWNAGNGERPKPPKQLRRSVRNPVKEIEEISNTITAAVNDPSVTQWVHMVCALWMPGTRCLNLGTMGIFDVSGVSISRRRLTCSICKREGGSCIQCHESKCAVPFHAWCAHSKGLLQIETVNDADGHVRFHGKCEEHADKTTSEMSRRGGSAVGDNCAKTEGYGQHATLNKTTRKNLQKKC